MLCRLNQRFDNWIFHGFPIDPESLAIYRIIYALYFLLVGVPSFVWLAAYPDVFYNPPLSLASLFTGFPNYAALQVVSTIVCVLFVLLLFGYKTPLVSILLTVTLMIGDSFKYAFGKIDHDLLPILIPCILAFSGWGTRFSLDAISAQQRTTREQSATPGQKSIGGVSTESPTHAAESPDAPVAVCGTTNWPVALIALLLALGFFTAGLPKFIGWVDFDLSTQGVRGWALRSYYVSEHRELLVTSFAGIANLYFWEILDILAVIFELGFLIVLPFPKAFRAYLALAILFHFSNLWFLRIVNFSEFSLVYLLFINWNPIRTYLLDHAVFTELWHKLRPWHIWLVLIPVLALYYIGQNVNSPFPVYAVSPLSLVIAGLDLEYRKIKSLVVLTLAAGITCYFAFFRVRQIFIPPGQGLPSTKI